jgi:hypothetical protein
LRGRIDFSPLAASMQGVLGYIDWRLHGKISQALKKDILQAGEQSLFVNTGKIGKATLILHHWQDEKTALKEISASLQKLNAKEVCVAESTFPENFLPVLKNKFLELNLQWSSLEPNKQ